MPNARSAIRISQIRIKGYLDLMQVALQNVAEASLKHVADIAGYTLNRKE